VGKNSLLANQGFSGEKMTHIAFLGSR
jgi:hypothetical protein